MFNSPLHYCKACNQYVALDQTVEECAGSHGCKVEQCRYAELFNSPAQVGDARSMNPEKPPPALAALSERSGMEVEATDDPKFATPNGSQ
jgi:hypothetical protein